MMKRIVIFVFLVSLMSGLVAAQEKVSLAAEDDWYPYSARRGTQAAGRSVDIVKAAYDAAGVSLMLHVVPFNRGMAKTKEGIYAGVFNGGLTEEIKRDYLIPRNYVAVSEQVAVARRGEPFAGKQSFNGKRLVLTNGYTYPDDITGDKRNSLYRAVGEINSLKMIEAGRADFTIMDRLVFMSLVQKEPDLKRSLQVVGQLHTENIYVFFAKTDAGERARAFFDQGMDVIGRNGVLKKIIKQWEARLL